MANKTNKHRTDIDYDIGYIFYVDEECYILQEIDM